MGNSENLRIKERFQKPDAFAASFPFWAWNAKLDPEEIKRQAAEMKKQGIGGFFMHSREGLETRYMGGEWQQCILAGIAAARELGMYAWLYDEDRWPSGTAGGQVTAGGDAYRCKGLTLEVCDRYSPALWEEKELMALYAARVEGDAVFSLRRLERAGDGSRPGEGQAGAADSPLREGEVCLAVRLEVSGPSEWFNNEAPPDNLNPDCVKRFISLTHEKYFELCGEEFGRTVPGIFTDEPSLADFHARFPANRSWIPWTYGFREYFEEKRGYDPLELIPYFYFNGEKSAKIRHDYWYMIAVRFSETYAKQISEWCEAHKLSMTGHFLQEDKLGMATRVSGAIMPLYEYEHIPGIDMLQEKTEEFMTVKQCASVAHQMGRRVVLSETYGCTGWEFTFEGQRRIGDWQYVLGVNRRCQHLALYSLAGCRKRDYPPCINYNTSWWKHYHMVENYFSRLSVMLEEGKPVQELLLLHPASTAWSRLGASPYGNPVRRRERDVPAVNAYGDRFNRLIQNLCYHHFDMDLGDEILLSKYGRVEGQFLAVGEARYHTWILPPIDTMLRSTFELLKSFLAAGGRVVALQPLAYMLEGEESGELKALWNEAGCTVAKERELPAVLERAKIRTVSVRDVYGNEDIHCLAQQRRTGEDETLFLVNMDEKSGHRVSVELYRPGRVERWMPLNGGSAPVESRWEDGVLSFSVLLGAADSALFRILREPSGETEASSAACAPEPPKAPSVYAGPELPASARAVYSFPKRTEIVCTMENTLTLERCRYRLDGEAWSEEMDIWQAQRAVRERLGMRPIHLNGQEQRYKWIASPHPSDGHTLELELCFWIDEMPAGQVSLALEHPENFEICCNGAGLAAAPEGWLLDRDIQKLPLKNLKEGENRLILRCRYRNAMELEDCYLCGAFGVTPEGRVVPQPKTLLVGDWTLQGFLHYAGGIRYLYRFAYGPGEGKRILLKLEDYFATCLCVALNGTIIEVPWKSASLLDVTELLSNGENRLEIEVAGSPRNLFGPFHLNDGKRDVTNDACFRAEGAEYTEERNVTAYGLFAAPRLYEA